jgi:large subunit ribosomal protein L18
MKNKIKKLYLSTKKRLFHSNRGTTLIPRLAVFRSNKHIYTQLIDDQRQITLTSASTLHFNRTEYDRKITPKQKAFFIGKNIAELALKRGIKKIVFDRRNKLYHGRIQELASGARITGLIF